MSKGDFELRVMENDEKERLSEQFRKRTEEMKLEFKEEVIEDIPTINVRDYSKELPPQSSFDNSPNSPCSMPSAKIINDEDFDMDKSRKFIA